MPALSPTMTTGNLVKWHKKEGDEVSPGDTIAEVETDKATVEFECQEEGYIAKILVPEGTSDIPINKLVAILVEEKEDVAKFANWSPSAGGAAPAAAAAPAGSAANTASAPAPAGMSSSDLSGIPRSPLARKLAEEAGIDLGSVAGTGPGGRILAADVKEFKSSGAAATARPAAPAAAPAAGKAAAPAAAAAAAAPATGSFTDIPLSNMRKTVAKRLLESKSTIPHYYLTVEFRIDELMRVRKMLNDQSKGDYKLSVNDFVIKASALSMRHVPAVNSSWMDSVIREYHNVDVSVAVATPDGLITPIVKNAHRKGLGEISTSVKDLAEKAKNNKLQPEEFIGGTFTISNLGMFGINKFSAIINPPQAAILAVGGGFKRVVPVEGQEDQFENATMMAVTLSCDHRVIDGAVGAEWLQHFKNYMENPLKMLL